MKQLSGILKIIKFSLNNLDTFSKDAKKINATDVSIMNEDTLHCTFQPYAANSNDIKLEIGGIMGVLNGFFRNGGFECISFANYALKAVDKNGVELMYAISPKATSELIGVGKSIDWLKATLFQENTDDYRLTQSKIIISEIENTLRELVKTRLKKTYGNNWWDISLSNRLGEKVKSTYFDQYGSACNDGDVLILYTYIIQLKQIISTHFKLFSGYFDSLKDFDTQMEALNKIRREEAHNRTISERNILDLNTIHEKLTGRVLLELTHLQSEYLTQNWKLKIKKIMIQKQYKSLHEEQIVLNEKNQQIKLSKTRQNIQHLILFLDDMLIKLKSISTPVHKKSMQRKLISVLEEYKDLQEELLQTTATLDEQEILMINARIEIQKKKMDDFVRDFLLEES